jgi:hypothetical protein
MQAVSGTSPRRQAGISRSALVALLVGSMWIFPSCGGSESTGSSRGDGSADATSEGGQEDGSGDDTAQEAGQGTGDDAAQEAAADAVEDDSPTSNSVDSATE